MGASMIWTMLISPNQLVQATPFFELGVQLLWGLIYNMMYFKHLFNRGFVPADDRSCDLLTRAHYWSQPKEK